MSRYLPPSKVSEFYQDISSHSQVSQRRLGQSIKGTPIHCYRLGQGPIKIMAWSQMHGNESTSTRALLDFCRWLLVEQQAELLSRLSFYVIAQLNPDGCDAYRRQNAVGVDINRDALGLEQPESRILSEEFQRLQPNLCLNLHDQNTKHAVGVGGPPAAISFLAPPVDASGGTNPAQITARQLIVLMAEKIQSTTEAPVGRFRHNYDPNCFGENFINQGVPTITLEAGHYPFDYQRHQSTKVYTTALQFVVADFAVERTYSQINPGAYDHIPNNEPEFVDLIVKKANLIVDGRDEGQLDLAVMFHEKLANDQVTFRPLIVDYGQKLGYRSHYRIVSNQKAPLPYQTDISNHYNFIFDSQLVSLIRQTVPSLKGYWAE